MTKEGSGSFISFTFLDISHPGARYGETVVEDGTAVGHAPDEKLEGSAQGWPVAPGPVPVPESTELLKQDPIAWVAHGRQTFVSYGSGACKSKFRRPSLRGLEAKFRRSGEDPPWGCRLPTSRHVPAQWKGLGSLL